MKATKQATPGTSGRSAPARGKFGKVCLVLLLLVTVMFCGFTPWAWAEPTGCWTDVGEDGKPLYADTSWYYNNPNESPEEYDLWNEADLAGLAYLVNNDIDYFKDLKTGRNKIVRLRAPVDMSAHYWEPIGAFRAEGGDSYLYVTTPGFVGTFDGGNHEISGIVVKNDGSAKSVYAGFFGSTSLNRYHPDVETTTKAFPQIFSVNIVNASIESGLEEHTITHITPSGSTLTLTREPVAAGIVADASGTSGTTIQDCTFSGLVKGYDAAGIVGQNNSGTTTSCVNRGGVSAVRYAGGIAARIVYLGNVVQSTNEGPVASDFAAGGIAGAHGTASGSPPGDIKYCSSTGPVYAEQHPGTIAGYIYNRSVGNDYGTCWYWLNGTGADVFPSGQAGNAKSSLGGSQLTLDAGTLVEAAKAETLADMPPTTVIFDYADAPFGRMKGYKTDYTGNPGRYIYPDEDGVYTLGPVAVYPTGSAKAENMIISSLNQTTLSRTKLTKEEYSKAYAVCMTSGYVGDSAGMGVRAENDDRMIAEDSIYGLMQPSDLMQSGDFLPKLHQEKIVPLPSVALSDATLNAGETTVLTASFDPDTTPQSARRLKWSSDNENVATVDASGMVTAVGVGQARITATSEVFEEASAAECVVTVNTNDVQIESVALDKTVVEIKPKDKVQLSASVLPEGSPQGVTWSSSNEEVASVDEAGLVTAIAEGTAVVTATSSADSSKYASCTVTVTDDTPPEPAKDPVVNADSAKEQSAAPTVSDTGLPEGVTVTPSLSPDEESAALDELKSGGETDTPNIDGIDRTEPGAVNVLTTFSLDVAHEDGADGDLTITLTLADAIDVADGSSLYALIPYHSEPQKFGLFICAPKNGAEITSVKFTVTGYARFFYKAPVILAAVKDSAPQPSGGGGGCSAGWGALALLAVVPLFARRKK